MHSFGSLGDQGHFVRKFTWRNNNLLINSNRIRNLCDDRSRFVNLQQTFGQVDLSHQTISIIWNFSFRFQSWFNVGSLSNIYIYSQYVAIAKIETEEPINLGSFGTWFHQWWLIFADFSLSAIQRAIKCFDIGCCAKVILMQFFLAKSGFFLHFSQIKNYLLNWNLSGISKWFLKQNCLALFGFIFQKCRLIRHWYIWYKFDKQNVVWKWKCFQNEFGCSGNWKFLASDGTC